MKAFVGILSLVAASSALPLEIQDLPVPVQDVPEVVEARAEFMKAFETAEMGKHIELAPAPVASAYMADTADVEAAKAEFMAAFEDAEAGKHAELAPKAAEMKDVQMPVVHYATHPYYAVNYGYHYAPAAVQYTVPKVEKVEYTVPKVEKVEYTVPKVATYTHTLPAYTVPQVATYTHTLPAYSTYNLGYHYPYMYHPVAVKTAEVEEPAVEEA